MSSNGTLSVISRIRLAWEPSTAACKQYVDPEALQDLSSSLISSKVDLIVAEYDIIVDRLGRNFFHGDVLFEADLQRLTRSELDHLHKLVSGQISEDSSGLEEEAQELACRASEKTLQALHDLASRLGYLVPSPNRDPLLSTLPQSSYVDIKAPYCKGALLLQNSETDVFSVITRQSSEPHYTCNHCFLEISDFRSCSSSYVEEDWFLLASCHVQACKSSKYRRAAYRCFPCSLFSHNEIEPSVAVFRDHIGACRFMKVYKWMYQESCEVRKRHSLPVSQPQLNLSPRPPLQSHTLIRDRSALLDTKLVPQVPNNTEYQSTPPRDKRDAVPTSNGNRPTTLPRRHSRQVSSPVSTGQAVPTTAPLRNSKAPRMDTKTEERKTRHEGPTRGHLNGFSDGFALTDSPAAPIASISQRPGNVLLPRPFPAAPCTSHPTSQATVSRQPDNVPPATSILNPPRIAHSSPANQASISQHPHNLLSSVPVPNSRRSPKIEAGVSLRPSDLLSAVPVSSSPNTSRYSIKNRVGVSQYPDNRLSATLDSSTLYTNGPYTNGSYANGASISLYPSPPYTNPSLPTNGVGISQYYPDNVPLSTLVPSPSNTNKPSAHRVSNSSKPDNNPTIIHSNGRLRRALRRQPTTTTTSLNDAKQYRPAPTTVSSTMSGGHSFGGVVAEDNSIRQLQELGISPAHAERVLRMAGGDVKEAQTLVFNEWMGAVDKDDPPPLGRTYPPPPPPLIPPSASADNELRHKRSRSRKPPFFSFLSKYL